MDESNDFETEHDAYERHAAERWARMADAPIVEPERIEARRRACERASDASWRMPSSSLPDDPHMVPIMAGEIVPRTAALIADAVIDERVPAMIDAAMRDPAIVARALMLMEPEHRNMIRVLLDALAERGL